MNDSKTIERALESLKPKQPQLEVISFSPSPAGSGPHKGDAVLRLVDGRTLPGCSVYQLSGDCWITLPFNREPRLDGTYAYGPSIEFASEAKEQEFQQAALKALDQYIEEHRSREVETAQAPGTLVEVHVEGIGNVCLVADNETADQFVKRLGIPRSRVWTEQERRLAARVDSSLRPAALSLKQQLGTLTAEALAELSEAIENQKQETQK